MISSGYYLIDSEYNLLRVNRTAKRMYPQLEVGKKCYACLMNLDQPCGPCPVANGVKGPHAYLDPIRNIVESVDAVEVELPGAGLCHALVFGTVEENDPIKVTLPIQSEELKHLALIYSLTVDYEDVFAVNLRTGSTVVYRHDGEFVDHDPKEKPILYDEVTRRYIEDYVVLEDQKMMYRKSSLEYMISKLKNQENLRVHYRVFYQGAIHYYCQKIVRVGDEDSYDQIMVARFCEDEEIQSQLAEKELKNTLRKVEYDMLTGLFTKEAFLIRAEKLLAEHPDVEYDLCVLNLENLGLINHQYSQLSGDKLLALIGRLLQEYMDDTNCIAYVGNGSYASLTMNQEDDARKASIMKFREDIVSQSDIKNMTLKWSLYKNIDRKRSVTDTYEKTVYALGTIRSKYHQEYVEFEQAMFEQMEWEEKLENDFQEALEREEFVLEYQPKYSLKTQKIIGAEALVRWKRQDGSVIPPARFIHVLEKCGKINQLDAYVFRQVCQLKKKMKEMGCEELPVSVNLSRASIYTEDIASIYTEMARSYGVETKYIPIEITESAAVRASIIKTFARELMEGGFALHMDDFGAGYSSLASLNVIPFECIKIDKSLVDYIGNEDNENMLKHVISFAHEQGKMVVAEGVETYEQVVFLKVVGCDAAQGYYYSKPISETEFLMAVESWR